MVFVRFPYIQVVAHATPPHWLDVASCEVCHKRIEQDEAVYRVDRWERRYAHALCVDRGAHLHKAILLGREMRGSIEPGLALLEWTIEEQRLYVH